MNDRALHICADASECKTLQVGKRHGYSQFISLSTLERDMENPMGQSWA